MSELSPPDTFLRLTWDGSVVTPGRFRSSGTREAVSAQLWEGVAVFDDFLG